MTTENTLYRTLIRKESGEGHFLTELREQLEKKVLPASEKNILYSVFRQAVVDGIPLDKLKLLKDVEDAGTLREYVIFIGDGADEEILSGLLSAGSSADDVRQRRYDHIAGFMVTEEELKAMSPAAPLIRGFPDGSQEDLLKKVDMVLKRLPDEQDFYRRISELQHRNGELEAEVKEAKRRAYEAFVEGLSAPAQSASCGKAESSILTRMISGRRKKSSKECIAEEPRRKEQLLWLLKKDITAEQLRFLTGTMRERPDLPFGLFEALARRDIPVSEMKSMVETYTDMDRQGKENINE